MSVVGPKMVLAPDCPPNSGKSSVSKSYFSIQKGLHLYEMLALPKNLLSQYDTANDSRVLYELVKQ